LSRCSASSCLIFLFNEKELWWKKNVGLSFFEDSPQNENYSH
jgi:hypothetical protein